ncbi:hypothetical protein V8F33_003867 [Rhypophila sp. PSN 637]
MSLRVLFPLHLFFVLLIPSRHTQDTTPTKKYPSQLFVLLFSLNLMTLRYLLIYLVISLSFSYYVFFSSIHLLFLWYILILLLFLGRAY